MTNTMTAKYIVAALLATSALPAGAATVFQSLPDLTIAPNGNWCSSCEGAYRAFDSFTLGSAETIASVTFAVSSNYHFPSPVDVSFWNSDGGRPSTQISSAVYAPGGFTSAVDTIYNTTLVSVDYSQSLAAGTYFVSFYSSTGLAVPSFVGGGGNFYLSGDPRNGGHGESAAFSLDGATGAVPEPVSWALMVVGFGLVGAAARRRTTTLTA
jgi:hypothetical protein